jgi:hypothetical protein
MAIGGRSSQEEAETALTSSQPILIYTPGVRALLRLLRIWLPLFVAVLMSYGVLWYVTIPLYLIIAIRSQSFLDYWRLYGYSRSMLFASTAAMLILSFLTAGWVRALVYHIARLVFGL